MLRWANTIICPSDPEYKEPHIELQRFCPWFDGCIGAIDGTHIPVEVKSSRKVDYINRKHYVSLNVGAEGVDSDHVVRSTNVVGMLW
jgi:hypothetical protein